MSSYCYEAVDSGGLKLQGTLDVSDQSEALRRIKEMGLFPIKIAQANRRRLRQRTVRSKSLSVKTEFSIPLLGGRVKPAVLAVFTRQLATLVEAGMPLLRGLRTLQEQEENGVLKRIIAEVAESIEGGSSLSEALTGYPKVFNRLYINMTKAGELGGALEVTLRRLAEFMEKAHRIKGKVKAALFYPIAVLIVAVVILWVLMVFIVPRFQQVFEGLLTHASMPGFTLFILRISEAVKNHFCITGILALTAIAAFLSVIRTKRGRWIFDRVKLGMPLLGPVFRKAAVSRFARTLGTLLNSGVPILQALTIVQETAGNAIVGNVISKVHESVKEGETIAVPLKASGVFPAMVAGMVDVGEQTGALPDMLLKIADTYDEEVDNSVSAMTSLIEPIMIVFLAVVVGSIVIAMYLPLLRIIEIGSGSGANGSEF
jgi:type IV pilus assembly protein PilC